MSILSKPKDLDKINDSTYNVESSILALAKINELKFEKNEILFIYNI